MEHADKIMMMVKMCSLVLATILPQPCRCGLQEMLDSQDTHLCMHWNLLTTPQHSSGTAEKSSRRVQLACHPPDDGRLHSDLIEDVFQNSS